MLEVSAGQIGLSEETVWALSTQPECILLLYLPDNYRSQ